MAKGESINLTCSGSASNYTYSMFPIGFTTSTEKCNAVGIDPSTALFTVNNDYSVTLDFVIPTTIPLYSPEYWTCAGFGNPAYVSSGSMPTISKATILISCSAIPYEHSIVITNPGDLTPNEDGHWIYTTPGCQFPTAGTYTTYTVSCFFEFDYSSAPVTVNPWGCYSDWSVGIQFGPQRPPIDVTYNSSGYVSGTAGSYDSGAGCSLISMPRQKKNRR